MFSTDRCLDLIVPQDLGFKGCLGFKAALKASEASLLAAMVSQGSQTSTSSQEEPGVKTILVVSVGSASSDSIYFSVN